VSVPWYTSFHLRFSYSSRGDPRDLHSFPTRLSSDLPLLDRMDVIRLSGYIAEEKVAIAKAHLWPKLLKRVNLKASQLSITDAALRRLVEGYAREAGGRQLEKMLHRIERQAGAKVLDTEAESTRLRVVA